MRLYVLALLSCLITTSVRTQTPGGKASSSEQDLRASGRESVSQALEKYIAMLKAQDAHGIANLFTPSGSMGHEDQPRIQGRDAIEKHLLTFSNYKVLSHEMVVLKVAVNGGTASQSGTFLQKVRTPEGNTVEARGYFMFMWQQQVDGSWLIDFAKTTSQPPSNEG